MRVAAEIQRGLLPEFAAVVPGYGVVGSTPPSTRWAATTTTSAWTARGCILALGDVSGKGTGAALLMTVLRAAVRGHWGEVEPAARRSPAINAPSART
jgi:serine phosphatase RsbU (regulator of sigma subunit)